MTIKDRVKNFRAELAGAIATASHEPDFPADVLRALKEDHLYHSEDRLRAGGRKGPRRRAFAVQEICDRRSELKAVFLTLEGVPTASQRGSIFVVRGILSTAVSRLIA